MVRRILVIFFLAISVSLGGQGFALYECVTVTKSGLYYGFKGFIQGKDTCTYIVDVYHPHGGCVAKEHFYESDLKRCVPPFIVSPPNSKKRGGPKEEHQKKSEKSVDASNWENEEL